MRLNCWRLVRGLDWFRVCSRHGVGFHCVSGHTRDPLVLAGVVLAMLLLGLIATWIPPNALCRSIGLIRWVEADRPIKENPSILLREE